MRATTGLAITNVGLGGRASCVALDSGEPRWIDAEETPIGLITAWDRALVVFGDGNWVRSLDVNSGRCMRRRLCAGGLGLRDSYVVDDVLVGMLAGRFHAVDLNTLASLWEVPELISMPLVGDTTCVVCAAEDVTCYELRSGAVRWRRSGQDFGGKSYRYGCIWDGRYYGFLGDALTCLDLQDGRTVWRCPLSHPMGYWYPYAGFAYSFFLSTAGVGIYGIIDMRRGEQVFEKVIGPRVPEPPRLKKKGLTARTRGEDVTKWRGAVVTASDTHTFLMHSRSGQIVVLERETGDVVQVVEIEGMPLMEPAIYENHLLLTDFNASVHCFRGAD